MGFTAGEPLLKQLFAQIDRKKALSQRLLSLGILSDMIRFCSAPSLLTLATLLAASVVFAAPKDKVHPQGKAVGHQDTAVAASSGPVTAAAEPAGTTAYTEPMGGLIITCPNNSDTMLTTPFHKPGVYTGLISSGSGNSVIVQGAPGWTTDEFVTSAAHYALICSGVLEGQALPILGNSTNTLTVDPGDSDLSTLTATDNLIIVPFWTLEALIGISSPNGLQILTYDLDFAGINLGASTVYTHYTTFGWYLGGTPSGGVILHPGEAFILRNTSGSDFSLIFSGNVQGSTHRTQFHTLQADVNQDNHVGLTTPTDIALSDANIGYPGDQLLIFDNSTIGTNKAASDIITFYETFGWYRGGTKVDDPGDPANLLYLKAGQGYIYRKSSSISPSAFDWAFTPSYLPF
jgi:uncharacterized protein (TIGR02597 family)